MFFLSGEEKGGGGYDKTNSIRAAHEWQQLRVRWIFNRLKALYTIPRWMEKLLPLAAALQNESRWTRGSIFNQRTRPLSSSLHNHSCDLPTRGASWIQRYNQRSGLSIFFLFVLWNLFACALLSILKLKTSMISESTHNETAKHTAPTIKRLDTLIFDVT